MFKKILHIWFLLPTPIRFILVGAYNTIFAYLLYVIIYYILQKYFLALIFSTIIGIFNNFILFKFFVFCTQGDWLKELVKTYISYIGIYILNIILLWFFIQQFSLSPYIAQLICSLFLPILSYFILKYFSFKKE